MAEAVVRNGRVLSECGTAGEIVFARKETVGTIGCGGVLIIVQAAGAAVFGAIAEWRRVRILRIVARAGVQRKAIV